MKCIAGFALASALIAASPAMGAAPQIKDITPSGVRRGELTELIMSGTNLSGNPRLIAPFPRDRRR